MIEAEHSTAGGRLGRVAFPVSWLVGAALGAYYLRRGWVPHDEGALSQSAERLLAGQLPHRDFDEIYTGGLSVAHAAAFRLFGENLWSMRLVLFAAFVAFLPAVYYIARRFVGPVGAAMTTLVAAAWTLPNYSASIPSWYNLFFAVFGTAALLRHLDTNERRWLVVAGAAAGISCLAKITGLYFAAAALVFLVYRESVLSAATDAHTGDSDRSARAFPALTAAAIALVALAIAVLVRTRAGFAGVVNLTAPVAFIATAVVARLWRSRREASGVRVRRLLALVWPFVAGAAAPILLFVLPYAISGSLGALWNGVFVLPTKRFTFASMGLLPVWTMRYGVGLALLFWWARRWPPISRRWGATLLGVFLLWVLLTARHPRPYEIVWYVARSLLPISVIAGSLLLARNGRVTATRAQELVLLLSAAALCALVQFPFAAPIYFLYVAPFALLASVAVSATWDDRRAAMGGVVLAFAFLFALLWINTGFIYAMGINHLRDRQTHLLALPRGGLRVTAEDKATYERTIAAIGEHARGDYIWAGPDAPEVYFLSGKRNPTRTLFDFFDEPAARVSGVLSAIDQKGVRVIVLHTRAPFSGDVPAALRDSLVRRFPRSERAGWFEIRWRE